MLFKIFTVHDSKAECYMPPFYLPASGQATRAFAEAINSKSHHFSKHPADYTLFEIGTWNDQTALTANIVPYSLGNGVSFQKLELGTGESDDEIDSVVPIQPN